MTLEEIRTFFAFNCWANDRILAACRDLGQDELARDMRTSHGSVRGTLVHTMWGEWVWFQRWLGESPKIVFDENDYANIDAIESEWRDLERARREFLSIITNEQMKRTFGYENRAGEHWEYTFESAMQHVLNHSTYHRGQVVTLLRQLGRTPPNTDFLVYFDLGKPATWS